MGAMSELHADVQAFEAKLHDGASHLVDEFKALVGKLLGEAETDAADVAGQAEPVVEAAKTDAGELAQEAVAGVEGIVDPAKPSA